MDKILVDTLVFYLPHNWSYRAMSLIDELSPLADEEHDLLDRVSARLPIMADLSRSDLLLYRAADADRAVVVAHARPHSVQSVHSQDQTGQVVNRRTFPLIARVLAGQRDGGASSQGQPGELVMNETWAVRSPSGSVIAALFIETTVVEARRHHRRSPVFRNALRDLQAMLVRGELQGADKLSSFGEHDGILFVDEKQQIRYVSGVAENLYRKLGHAESLLRHSITSLGTSESAYFAAAERGECVEVETQEGQLVWIRKAIPVRETQNRLPLPLGDRSQWRGTLLMVSDVTDIRRRERELMGQRKGFRERLRHQTVCLASDDVTPSP